MKSVKVVKVDAVIGELNFQKKEMVNWMNNWKVEEEVIDMAVSSFDDVIHGVEAHLEEFDLQIDDK